MKEIINFFAGRRYSAVNTCEMQVMDSTIGKNHKSLNQNRPSLNRGLSVLDALFHERKQGKQTRSPTCKFKDMNKVKINSGKCVKSEYNK